jgi:hypothetical protein
VKTTHPLNMPPRQFHKYIILWSINYKYKNSGTIPQRIVCMVDKNTVAIIIEAQQNGYMVSALKTTSTESDSYTESLITPAHPLYNKVHEIAAILNIAATADEEAEVEGVGTTHGQGIYSTFITADEAKLLMED